MNKTATQEVSWKTEVAAVVDRIKDAHSASRQLLALNLNLETLIQPGECDQLVAELTSALQDPSSFLDFRVNKTWRVINISFKHPKTQGGQRKLLVHLEA